MTDPVLAIDGLSISLPTATGPRLVVDGISLSIAPGEAMGLVGESGSGKSLTALACLGMLPGGGSARGSILVRGLQAVGADAKTLHGIRGAAAAIVFQNPMVALNPYFTIGRQLTDIIRNRHGVDAKGATKLAEFELERVQLPQGARALGKYPHQFSGGQLQRIMIAAALACRPALLIADEPTTALDVTIQAEILALLKQLRRDEGLTMLFISHDLGAVADLCDRICVMESGRIVETGQARSVLSFPKHPLTRSLVDSLPRFVANERSSQMPDAHSYPLVRVEGASKSYVDKHGPHKALDDVGMSIDKGRSVAVVGESGSGKSTLAMSILGLIPLDKGRIEVEGIELGTASRRTIMELRSRIGVVFQNPYSSLNPRMSAIDLVAEPLRAHGGVSRREQAEAAGDLLDLVGIEKAHHLRRPASFSGGQRQRIAIARALILKPQLVILDEPTAALDVSLQSRVVALLEKLRGTMNLSYLFITHNMAIVEQVADEMIVMQRGRIVEQGSVARVLRAPSELYTTKLLNAARQLAAAV